MHKKIISTVAIGIIIGATSVTSYAQTNMNDIGGHWANKQIQNFINSGYINGYEDKTFKPDNSITRAEFIKIVNRYFGFESKSNINFRDVSQRDWFYNDVCIAKQAGYINGYEDGTFKPDKTITREEVAKILISIKHKKDFTYDKLQNFIDKNNVSEWAKPYVEGAIEAKYINGNEKGELNPTKNITRAESVVMISRADKKIGNPWDDDPVLVSPTNQAPRIYFDSITINQGDSFNYSMLNIRVIDPEEGEFSSDRIKIIGDVDTNRPGNYEVTITATDNQGRSTEKHAIVIVRENKASNLVDKLNSSAFKSQVRAEMFKLVNNHRTANGLTPYKELSRLDGLADSWSKYQGDNGFCSHTNGNGQTSDQLFPSFGGAESENVLMIGANESTTPQELANNMFNMWKASAGHNAAMLDDWMYTFGFGYHATQDSYGNINIYATQEFSAEGAPEAPKIK